MSDRGGDGENIFFERRSDCLQSRGFFRLRALAFRRARPLGITQRYRVVAEHADRARHGADFVAAIAARNRNTEIAFGHQRHRTRHAAAAAG